MTTPVKMNNQATVPIELRPPYVVGTAIRQIVTIAASSTASQIPIDRSIKGKRR
jgi:hypothetical protein